MRSAPLLIVFCALLAACSGEEDNGSAEGEVVDAPFEARGEMAGLLLVWFDDDGPHVAASRTDIPEAQRSFVRVDDLSLGPDEGAGVDMVYVADLSAAGADGDYVVRRLPREAFDARVSEARTPEPTPVAAGGGGDADVIIYGASWCSACRSTAAFLRDNDVPFVERDIEQEPGAREAMQRAARTAGVQTSGIPVIDFRGEIIAGFNRGALRRAIERSGSPI